MMRTLLFLSIAIVLLQQCLASPVLEGFPLNAIKKAKTEGLASVNDKTKLYLFNGTNHVPGGNALLEFDVASKTFKTIMTNSQGQNDCVSASIVCGDTYYAVWTQFPAAAGVLKVDLNKGTSEYLGTGAQRYIYHALQCGANGSSLVGFASQMPDKQGEALSFQLVHMDTSNGQTTEVGALPKVDFLGFDGAFKFSPDGSELYASFAGSLNPGSLAKGELYIMDVATGKVKEHHKLPSAKGFPYGVFPTGSDTFHMAFKSSTSIDVTMCQVTKKDSGSKIFPPTVKTSGCTTVDSLWAGSAPSPTCDGVLYSVKHNTQDGESQPMTAYDFSTGKPTNVVDLATVIPGSHIGTVACA